MRRDLDGCIYDTSEAEAIANWSNNLERTDLNYTNETLYRMKNGDYFLHGEGGGDTYYGRPGEDGSWGYGQLLRPFDEYDGLEWCQEHDLQLAIDAHFSHLLAEG